MNDFIIFDFLSQYIVSCAALFTLLDPDTKSTSVSILLLSGVIRRLFAVEWTDNSHVLNAI